MMWVALFPGQGSQAIGMGRFYYENFLTAKKLFKEAEDSLKINFKKLCFEGSETDLALTQNTQTAITLVSCVGWFCLKEAIQLRFQYAAGHSVGEYSALTAAGTLSFTDTMQVVRKRGLWMNKSCPAGTGGMSALIGPSPSEAKSFCKWVEKSSSFYPLQPANFNTPSQTVLSGSIKALNWAKEHIKKYAFSVPAKLIPLKVSGPFHSSLMQQAFEKMSKYLMTIHFNQANFPILQNTRALPVKDPLSIRNELAKQVKSAVLWSDSIQYLHQQSCSHFIEFGHGKVLSNLMKKILPNAKVLHFHSLEDIKKIHAEINSC